MKKLSIDHERDQRKNLLNMILLLTKEGQSYAIQNDIVNLVKIIKLREGFVSKLKEICHSSGLDDEIFAIFLTVEKESKLLMEKMKLSQKIISQRLVSLHNGKQVVKYY